MNCLCCGKPLGDKNLEHGWHKRCIRKFFGTKSIPGIEIDEKTLERLAEESTNKGYTVPGVQKKLSLHLLSDPKHPRLTLVNFPTGYILKPQVAEFTAMPESEHLVIAMAEASGIITVPHALIEGTDGYAYITKRVDRRFEADGMQQLAMEDFCQLDQRLTQDKYKGSYERCIKVIQRYSSQSGLDLTELFMRIVFSFLAGNSDMHLKNFSLLETDEGSQMFTLSPAYDLLPVNLIMPEDEEELALPLNGKKKNLRRKDFLLFAESCGIPKRSAEAMMGKLISMKETYLQMCQESLLNDEMKQRFAELIESRVNRIG